MVGLSTDLIVEMSSEDSLVVDALFWGLCFVISELKIPPEQSQS